MKRVAITFVALLASLIMVYASSALAAAPCQTTVFPYGVAPSSGAPASVTIYIPNTQSELTQVVPFTVTNSSGAGFPALDVSVPDLPSYLTATIIDNTCARSGGGLPSHGTCTFSVALTSDGSTEGSGFVLQPKVRDDAGGGCRQSPVPIPVSVVQATLNSITVTPPAGSSSPVSISVNQSVQFSAIGSYSDGYNPDISSLVNWSVSPAAIATVGNGSDGGLVMGAAAGTGTVMASFNGVSASAPLAVTNPLLSISVTPQSSTILTKDTQQYSAVGTYADGSTKDITNSSTWGSNQSVATVNAAGLATGVAVGTTSITATNSDITSPAATLIVKSSAPVLQSISISPVSQTTQENCQLIYRAFAHYSDGSKQNISKTANWVSSNTSVATVTQGKYMQGAVAVLCVLNKSGTTNITASINNGSVSSAPSVLTVEKPASTGDIVIAPTKVSIFAGDTYQYTATRVYADGSKKDITNAVVWLSSNPAVATIAQGGLVSGVVAGTAQITASYTTSSGSILNSNSSQLAVTAPTVTAVTVGGGSTAVPPGASSQPFTALCTYSNAPNASPSACPASVTWSLTSNTEKVDCSAWEACYKANTSTGSIDSNGIFTGGKPGDQYRVWATVNGAANLYGPVITVSTPTPTQTPAPALTPTLQSIAVTPTTSGIQSGSSQSYTATGSYSDGSQKPMTKQVSWSVSGAGAAISPSGVLSTAVCTAPNNRPYYKTLTVTASSGSVVSQPATISVRCSGR